MDRSKNTVTSIAQNCCNGACISTHKNTSVKRSTEEVPKAELQNVVNGSKAFITDGSRPFTIGNSQHCDVQINDEYMQGIQYTILYSREDDNFVIYNNAEQHDIHLNCKPLPKENRNCTVIKNTDIIAFQLKDNHKVIYKFIVHTNSKNNIKLDELIENCQDLMNKIQLLGNSTLDALQDAAEEIHVKSNTNQQKYEKDLDELNDLKCKINCIFKENFECFKCKNIVNKPETLHCGHSFCHNCITKLVRKRKNCPSCDAKINFCYNSSELDNYMKDMSEFIEREINGQEIQTKPNMICVDLTVPRQRTPIVCVDLTGDKTDDIDPGLE